jgi:hypothetical protein
MLTPHKPSVSRRAVRKNPTIREATKMQWAMYDVAYMQALAEGVQRAIHDWDARPEDPLIIGEPSMRFTFEQAIPTLLIMKLSAAVEDSLDILWSRRFPEVKPRQLRHEDKLAVMEKLHDVNLKGIRELWKLRNECAHAVRTMATMEEFEKHYHAVDTFVALFQKKDRLSKT